MLRQLSYVCVWVVCLCVRVRECKGLADCSSCISGSTRQKLFPPSSSSTCAYHSTHMTVLPTDNLGVGGGHAVNSQCYNYFPALLLRSTRLCLMQVCKTNHMPRLLRRHLTKQLPADRTSKRHVTCNQCTHVNCIGRCVAATCQGSISHNKGS